MTEKLKNKILIYTSLVSGINFIPNDSDGQIIYQDILPDDILTGTGNYYYLDLNGDLNDDLSLLTGVWSSNGTFVSGPYVGLNYNRYNQAAFANPNANNEIIIDGMGSFSALNLNDPINASANFYNLPSSTFLALGAQNLLVAQSISYSDTNYQGNWPGVNDKFLGLKFIIGTNIHYGWLRMDLSPDCDTLIIKDFAYNSTPNQGLLAGQTTLDISESEIDEFTVFISQNNLVINRKKDSRQNLEIYTIDGKLIFEKEIMTKTETISIPGISNGIYLIKIGSAVSKIKI